MMMKTTTMMVVVVVVVVVMMMMISCQIEVYKTLSECFVITFYGNSLLNVTNIAINHTYCAPLFFAVTEDNETTITATNK